MRLHKPGQPQLTAAAVTREQRAVVTPLAAIAEEIAGPLHAGAEEAVFRRLRLLDTVDQRLTSRGWRLEAEAASGETERWRLVDGKGRVRAAADIPEPSPRLVDDLPDGPLYRALEPLVGMRGLLPTPWIALTEHRSPLRDGDGKIRCRLLAQGAAVEETGQAFRAVRVEPLKGYKADADRVAERISRRYGWPPTAPDPLRELSLRLHGEAGGTAYPAVADPTAPAGPALRPVLRALLDTVEHRAAGVIADIDCEELHDLRVAVRRSRSILTLLRTGEPQPELDRAREFFAWLGKVTGPTRDLDVHILDWRAHRRRVPAEQAADLEPLGRFLMAKRDSAHAALVKTLRSAQFRNGVKRWRRTLDADGEAWTSSSKQRRPIGRLAGRRIRKLYKRAVREGSAITPASADEALHALRKTMKKLRYVFEIIREAYPQKPARAVLKTFKDLQQVLGDVQDGAVQAEALRHYGEELGRLGTAAPATLMAIGAMAEDLEIRRTEARARFAAAFAPVAHCKFGERLRRLTRAGMGDGA